MEQEHFAQLCSISCIVFVMFQFFHFFSISFHSILNGPFYCTFYLLSAVGYLKYHSIVFLIKFSQRTKQNLKCNHMRAILKFDCFLVSWESDVIGCCNNEFDFFFCCKK